MITNMYECCYSYFDTGATVHCKRDELMRNPEFIKAV